MNTILTLLFLMVFFGSAGPFSRQERPYFIRPANAEPPNVPKTPDAGRTANESGLGVQEIPRSDGGKDVVYFSVTTPEEERKKREEEREKTDKSMEVLRNVIIDQRHR